MANGHPTSKRLSELTETFKKRATSKVSTAKIVEELPYQIPLFGDLERVIPNHLARSFRARKSVCNQKQKSCV